MSAKIVYTSGPMTGYPEFNYPAFNATEVALTARGYRVLNPARHPAQDSWEAYLRLDLVDLAQADLVAVLPGWRESRGATLEVHVAHALGMPVVPVEVLVGERP